MLMRRHATLAMAFALLLGAMQPLASASHAPAELAVVPVFTNVTLTTGLGSPGTALTPQQIIVEDSAAFLNGGKGGAWFDYDQDGWEDLLITGYHKRELYRNNGDGTFSDVTDAAGLEGAQYTMGVITPDFNNDGFPDVVLANWYARCEIFLNNGDGTFRNMSSIWNFYFSGPSAGLAFGDVDGDGWGDLYIGSYYRRSNGLFRNLQGQGLEDMTEAAGVRDLTGYTFQVLMFDYDLDGDIDLFDANDFGADALFRNEGNFSFTDVSVEAGVAIRGDGMGAAIGDLNDDGYMDVFVTNFADDHWSVYDPANKSFVEAHAQTEIIDPDVGWGVNIHDFNNDGFLDVFIANGRVMAGQIPEADKLWINRGNGTFFEAGGQAGVRDFGINRGSAVADFNRDGQLDLWVSNVVANSSAYRNGGTGNHWLEVKLGGVVSVKDAVGARLTLEAGGRTQTRVVHMGSSYLSQDSLIQHFGLGAASLAERLTVDWPSGVRQVFTDLSADQRIFIGEYESNAPAARAPDVFRDAGLEVTFDASASTDDTRLVAWTWSFADPYLGVTLAGPSPTHTFYEPANFTGTLTVTDAFGNFGSSTFNVSIRAVGHPLVWAGPDLQLSQNGTALFSATLMGGPAWADYANTSFAWTITGPDGTASLGGRNVSRTFAIPGTYSVAVVATDIFGATGSDSLVATVGDNQPPVIVFTPPVSVPEDTPFALDASTTYDNDPTFPTTGLFYWRLQGALGQFEVRVGSAPEFSLRDPGPVRFDLEVNDSTGNLATRTFVINAIDGTPPLAEGGGDRLVAAGRSVTLDASSSSDNDPTLKQAGTFEWLFLGPDGVDRAIGVSVSLTLTLPGVTQVRLHVVDPSGNAAVQDDEFYITALDQTAPVIAPIADQDVTFGEPALFAASGITDNDPSFGDDASYLWTVTDSIVRTFPGKQLNYTFAHPGRWPVRLTVSDAAGNSATQEFHVTVSDRTPPVLVASVPREALVGQPVMLNASESTDDVGVVSFVWVVSDPAAPPVLNGRFIPWTFRSPGNYTITLLLSDGEGNAASRVFDITIRSADAPVIPPGPDGGAGGNAPGDGGQGGALALAALIAGAAAGAGAVIALRRRRQGQA